MSTPSPSAITASVPERGKPSTLLDATLDADVHGQAATVEGALPRGALVGRYVVVSRVGAGGMGVVYGAYDPELERRVAIKLLHTDLATSDVSEGRRRLLREAQALAKLSHPNVVAVHDVGTLGGRVWLAMEFLEGETLGAWRKATQRGWREVVEVMRAAGLGLAAAHEVGLVHRDFKPDNVMVESAGARRDDAARVRVMDFGLARPGSGSTEAAERDPTGQDHQSNVDISRAGTVIGTPPYMAPEQHLGLVADARSDQFAFCVTLWECLWGERPFAGETVAALAQAIVNGELKEPPREPSVPAWLRRICMRGLAADPAHRFASMGELLAALERGRRSTRRRRWIVGLAACALVPAGMWTASAVAERSRVAGCRELGAEIERIWPGEDARAKERSRVSFAATGLGYAEDAAMRTHAALDENAARWREARTQACLDRDESTLRGRDLAARADECLDERRLQLAALVDRIVDVDLAIVPVASQSALGLPQVDPCLDAQHLAQRPALPQDGLESVHEARMQLATSAALARAGDYDAALVAAREGLALAEALQWAPLVADARRREGGVLQSLALFEPAEQSLVQAYLVGAAADAHEIAADAALQLVDLVGTERGDLGRAEVWSYAAEVAVAIAEGEGKGPRWATLVARRADLALDAGDHQRARELQEEALALRESVFGVDSSEATESRAQLASVLHAIGDFARARELYQRVLEDTEASLGPEHPAVASRLSNLGVIVHEMGDPLGARALHERALAIRERALGTDHIEVAHSLSNLANSWAVTGEHTRALVLRERALAIAEEALGDEHTFVAAVLTDIGVDELALGHVDRARTMLERALRITEQALGPDHPSIVTITINLANVESEGGNADGAIRLHRRALELGERRLGAEHPLVGAIENNLGTALMRKGDVAEAKSHYARALAVWEQALGVEHPNLAFALAGLGDVALLEADPRAAIPLFERALTIRERSGAAPSDLADTRFGLARARFETGLPLGAAREQMQRARTEFEGAGNREGLALVDAWLAEHPG